MNRPSEEIVNTYRLNDYEVTDIDYDDNDEIVYLQMVKNLGNDKYKVLDWSISEEYNVNEMFEEEIDVPKLLNKYYEDIDEWCTMYYTNGISDIREIYTDNAGQIIAEIIAEMGGV